MNSVERVLVSIEGEPWGAVVRGLIGIAMSPVFRLVAGGSDSIIVAVSLFFGVLIALRVVPAVLRHALGFSAEAKEIWRARRNISKRYDSFAWQKLFWMGLGLLTYLAVIGPLKQGEYAVMMFCLVGGGIGLFLWRRTSEAQAKPQKINP